MDTMILHTMNSFHSYGLGCHSQLGYAYLIRYIENKSWLKETYSQCFHAALLNLDTAFRNFFRDPEHFHYPRFKSRKGKQSLQFPQNVKVDFQNQMTYFPKRGWIRTVFHRRFEGKIKTVTLTKETDGSYYVSILVESDIKAPVVIQQSVKDESDVLGIDMDGV